MSISFPRRSLLRSLPALALLPIAASAETSVHPDLLLNAADSLQHYINLLDKVSSDAFEQLAIDTTEAVKNCNSKLESVRSTVAKLQAHLKSQKDFPDLQNRFNTLEQSLASMQGDRPGQQNAAALRALPETLDALRVLMNQVAKNCDLDTDGETARLLDEVYSRMKEQNEAVAKVATTTYDWGLAIEEVRLSRNVCETSIGDASIAIAAGAAGDPHWKPTALKALDASIKALNKIMAVNQSEDEEAAIEGRKKIVDSSTVGSNQQPAALVLHDLLQAAGASLNNASNVKPAACVYANQLAQGAPPSVALDQNNSTLIDAVRQLVHPNAPARPKYFTPGVTTQIVNCIAVCLPVWLVYSSNTALDIDSRTSLIGNAIHFGLIHGTVPIYRNELRDELQGLYLRVITGGQA